MELFEKVELTLTPEPIDDGIKQLVRAFKDVLTITYRYYHEYNDEKHGKLSNEKYFKQMKQELKQYMSYLFMEEMNKEINEINQELIKKAQAKRSSRNNDNVVDIDNLIKLWQTHDIEIILSKFSELEQRATQYKDKSKDVFSGRKNPFVISNPMFLIRDGLLQKFEVEQIKTILEMNLDEYVYSYMPLPQSKLNDFRYIAYYTLNLQKDNEPVKVTSNLKQYLDMTYGDDESYNELTQLIKQYLNTGNRSLVSEIIQSLQQFPEILELNNKAKEDIDVVYRGVGDVDNINEIINQEKENRFVATSISKDTAERFALGITHLQPKSERNTNEGIILTYNVNPEDIVLDTTIFGGIFGEGEIIIDTTDTTIENYERV